MIKDNIHRDVNKTITVFVTDSTASFNPFNKNIGRALLEKNSIHYHLSVKDFWTCDPSDYQILHIQWPEYLIKEKSQEAIFLLKERLREFRDNKVPIVITHHNSLPHLLERQIGINLYSVVYNMCDVVIHLAKYSLGLYKFPLNSEIKEVVIPHPCYQLGSNKTSKVYARNQLNISQDKKVYLVSGNIRSELEGKHIIRAFDAMNSENKFLIIPSWEGKVNFKKPLKHPLNAISFGAIKVRQFFQSTKRFGLRKLSDEQMNLYLSAADVLIVPRVGLNSGVFYLGLAYGLPMICASSGNTGNLADDYGNFIYEYGNSKSLLDTMLKKYDEQISQNNLSLAESKHSLSVIAQNYKELYYSLL